MDSERAKERRTIFGILIIAFLFIGLAQKYPADVLDVAKPVLIGFAALGFLYICFKYMGVIVAGMVGIALLALWLGISYIADSADNLSAQFVVSEPVATLPPADCTAEGAVAVDLVKGDVISPTISPVQIWFKGYGLTQQEGITSTYKVVDYPGLLLIWDSRCAGKVNTSISGNKPNSSGDIDEFVMSGFLEVSDNAPAQ